MISDLQAKLAARYLTHRLGRPVQTNVRRDENLALDEPLMYLDGTDHISIRETQPYERGGHYRGYEGVFVIETCYQDPTGGINDRPHGTADCWSGILILAARFLRACETPEPEPPDNMFADVDGEDYRGRAKTSFGVES